MPKTKASYWVPALIGGMIGALLTVAALFALPGSMTARIVRSAMLADPAILSDTADALRDAQYAPVLEANRAAIEQPFASSWRGAAKGDVTVVEFFDYACPYCKASNPDIDRLVAEDKGVRVVYRELPILGPDSVTAARLSLAASKAGRFNQFHDALWAAGKPGPETFARASAAAGIAPVPTNDADIEGELKRNFDLAGKLGATGTPLFIVGDRVISGAAGYESLKAAVAAAREAD
ncbi:MAG: DsbA family protein [Sphingomicrobium sp.]